MRGALSAWYVCFTFLLSVYSFGVHAGARHDFSVGSFYAEGYYGRDNLTSMAMVPLKYRYQRQVFSLTMNTAWIELNGTAVEAITRNERHSSRGFTDWSVDLDYYWRVIPDVFLSTGAKVKWPLATRASGLSTGKRDHEINLAIITNFPRVNAYARISQQWRNDPADINLHDRQKYFVSVLYRVSEQYTFALSGDYQQAATILSDAQKNTILSLDTSWNSTWQISPYLLRGVGRSSPDRGAGIQFRFRYTTKP